MDPTPILVIAYNRPQKLRALIDSLRIHSPKLLIFSCDGPNPKKQDDARKVLQVRREIEAVDWNPEVKIISHQINLGLRQAVVFAVTEVLKDYEQVIVLEDDVLVGPEFLSFMAEMLSFYKEDLSIGHISGYNVVPISRHEHKDAKIRLSRYPESVAWATWRRSWAFYDDEMEWARGATLKDIQRITGSFWGGVQWKLNFLDAASGRVSSWAYRWIASNWAQDRWFVSPTRNLVTYRGFDEGTHTTLSAPWTELPVEPLQSPYAVPNLKLDEKSESWLRKRIFKETFWGVLMHVAINLVKFILRRSPSSSIEQAPQDGYRSCPCQDQSPHPRLQRIRHRNQQVNRRRSC